MIDLAILLIPSVVLGYLLWRADQRYDEAERAWRLERVGLLTRIQRPDLLPVEALPQPTGEPLHVPVDQDTAWEDYLEAREKGEAS